MPAGPDTADATCTTAGAAAPTSHNNGGARQLQLQQRAAAAQTSPARPPAAGDKAKRGYARPTGSLTPTTSPDVSSTNSPDTIGIIVDRLTAAQSSSGVDREDDDSLNWDGRGHVPYDTMPFWSGQEELVISGVSGRFPQCDNVQEFGDALMRSDDLITEDAARWQPGFLGLPPRHGKLKDLTKFDAQFFGVAPVQANFMDPQMRLLLEVAYEAMMDAGVNPAALRGTRTGVFVGASASETQSALTQDAEQVSGYSLTGCTRSMFANRLSYTFDLRGPSFSVDTACSSSLLALHLAVDALRTDQCDAAIVAGAHLTLMPNSALQFLKLNMLSDHGTCRSFDASGSGYCRGEAVVALLVQKASVARRCYATVVHAKSNTDGYKDAGITVPSGERQAQLLNEVYSEAHIDPASVAYVEAHGTGTKVGDPLEANALAHVFCGAPRPQPLLIGSVKSNMGHSEPASGLCSVAKIIVAMERKEIPATLHFKEPNPNVPAFFDGTMQVVSQPTPWNGGLVGVNSFGFGGSNTHVCLRSNFANPAPVPSSPLPKLVLYSGRTADSVSNVLGSAAVQHADQAHFHQLLSEQADLPVKDNPFRGYALFNRTGENTEPVIDVQKVSTSERRPLWFVYSGMGAQWPGMCQDMMQLDVFKDSILKCSEALRPLGVDPYSMMMRADKDVYKNTMNSVVCITATQIALTDLLRHLGLHPDGIIGHSTGEMACSYVDGCLTREQTMMLAYYRGNIIVNSKLHGTGAMAAVGLTWDEAQKRAPEGVTLACYNGYDSVTVSGLKQEVHSFVEQLQKEEIFAKMVAAEVPFHSKHMQEVCEPLHAAFSKIIPEPKLRSSKWLATGVPEDHWDKPVGQYCSADFHCHNAMNPVMFYPALKHIPENAIVVEVAPHCLLQAILRRSLKPTNTNIGIMHMKEKEQIEFFLKALGRIHQQGCAVQPQRLYPSVAYPVPPGTPMIAPLLRWEHAQSWPVCSMADMSAGSMGGAPVASVGFTVDPFKTDLDGKGNKETEAYLLDHVIDGRPLFPFTGHLVLVWRAVAKLMGEEFEKVRVMFKDVYCYKPTILSKAVKFAVTYCTGTGYFEIMEGDNLTAAGHCTVIEGPEPNGDKLYRRDNGRRRGSSGTVSAAKMPDFFYKHLPERQLDETSLCDKIELTTDDIYKEFTLRGYEYGPAFRGIHKARNSGFEGTLVWTGNWVTFLDALLQTALLCERGDMLRLPTRLRYMRIDPVTHLNSVIPAEDGSPALVHLYNDLQTSGMLAGGVESADLIAQTVPRRLYGQPKSLHLEKIEWTAYFDDECMKMFPQDATDIERYAQLCHKLYGSLAAKWRENGVWKALDGAEGAAMKKNLKNVAKGHKSADLTEEEKSYLAACVDDYSCTLAQLLAELGEIDVKQPAEGAESIVAMGKQIVADKYASLSTDKLWHCLSHQRALKMMIDTVMENVGGHLQKFLCLEPDTSDTIKSVFDLMSTHPLLEVEFAALGPSVDRTLKPETLDSLCCVACKYDLDGSAAGPDSVKNYDLAILSGLLHRKVAPQSYLQKVASMLRDDGFVLLMEPVRRWELAGFVELLRFGTPPAAQVAEGQKIEEMKGADVPGERAYGMFYTVEQWTALAEKAGYQVVARQTDPVFPDCALLLRKIPQVPREPCFVNVNDVEQFSWIEPLKAKIDERLSEGDHKTIWLVSDKPRDNGTVGMALCFREEGGKKNQFRSISDADLCDLDAPVKFQIDSPEVKRLIETDLHANNYRGGKWGRMTHYIVEEKSVYSYAEVPHAYINTITRGDLSSLKWVESMNTHFSATKHADSQRLAAVYYAAVNFRDVMLATGRLPPDAIPGRFADRDCLLGMEFAGRDEITGERVMGILPAQGLATTVVYDQNYSWAVPTSWTLEEAATVPVVYTTAYYALVVRGRAKRGQSILIHSGSGGVGQAAIAVALSLGLEVYTTVGSKEKREFLMERFPQLREDRHFANSRSASDFEWHVRNATGGRGVDLVLNSLADDKLQASLRCLATHGRFLEIGKFDLSNNAPMGMSVFLKNVTFHGILLDSLLDCGADESSADQRADWLQTAALMLDGIRTGVVKPIHRTVFDSEHVEEAFRFMASGKHVGKVLLRVRHAEQDECSGANVLPPAVRVRAIRRTICDPRHAYLITGGLGGFGLELANWLVLRGARKLVLSSRSGIRTGYQARCVHFWRRSGVSVLVSTHDIAAPEGATELLKQCLELGPVGGIFHLAMVLRDCMFENQHVQNFREAAAAKYYGTKNLDAAARQMCGDELKWFVGFSSVSAGRGNAGQTNYGWANAAMERVIELRRKDGLAGLNIQWGAIGDTGIIIEKMGGNEAVVGGTVPQRMQSCLMTLDLFLTWDTAVTVSSYVRADVGHKKAGPKSSDVLATIAHIMGVGDPSTLDPNQTLADLGLDSLMGVEIKQAMERNHDIVLSMKDIRMLSLAKLKEMAESGGRSAEESSNDVPGPPEEDFTQAALEQQMHELFKLRVDVNDMNVTDKVVACNDVPVVAGKPIVWFVHSIEGIATPLLKLARELPYASFCVQNTPTCPSESIESMAKCYFEWIKERQPTGPYHIVGYSYGACIAFELAKLFDKSQLATLILLDGSHHYMKTYRRIYRLAYGITAENLANNPLFEAEILCSFTMRFANIDYKVLRAKLLGQSGWRARVAIAADDVMAAGMFKSSERFIWTCDALRAKFLAADRYSATSKWPGNLTLIRAKDGAAREEDVGNDYGLHEIVSGNVSVEMVEGDHDTIVSGDQRVKTAQIITELVDSGTQQQSAD